MLMSVLITSAMAAQIFPPVADLPERKELPDALTFFDGRPVETPEQWMEERRPELKALFQHYMYGFAPPAPELSITVLQEDHDLLDGQATLRQVELQFSSVVEGGPKLRVALFLPNAATAPVPVFIGINKCGNHEVLDDPRILIQEDAYFHSKCAPLEERGASTAFWSVAYLIERGYGFAAFHESDIDPDEDDFSNGVHAAMKDYPYDPEHGWATIAAWAWGFHRVVDFLQTQDAVDHDKIAVVGHSRRGKTALLAAALDERIALCVPHQSGTGGMALSRDNDQETVERINRVFPHWFNGAFKQFNDNEYKLPFDQHLLAALIAPRLLFDTEGLEDKWANYDAAWRGLQETGKVYAFLGHKEAVRLTEEPVRKDNLSRVMQYRLDTKHTLTPEYWTAILDFADLHFNRE